MRKEILVAIFIGICLGLIIILGVWIANKSLLLKKDSSGNQTEKTETINPSPTPLAKESISLEIIAPKDNSISSSEFIELSGKTNPNAIIAVVYPDGETILEAEDDGSFTTKISLIGADNEIKITAYDLEGNEETKIINIVFSTAKI